MVMANILAYYVMKIITALKRFIEQTNGQTTQVNKMKPGPNVIKHFTSVIYECS
jgi:hypothetical protein